MSDQDVLYENRGDGVVLVTLNRPEKVIGLDKRTQLLYGPLPLAAVQPIRFL